MTGSFSALLIATITVAVVHSLAPDHWLPFVMIGKAQGWSKSKLAVITMLSGIAHVGSSVILGSVGILLGIAAIHLKGVEAVRGHIGILLLIGFGVGYAIWGFRRSRTHRHRSLDLSTKKVVTLWTLFAVFVLGPCEPLIPLMFLATSYGEFGVILVTVIFTIATLLMMAGQALLGSLGVQIIKHHAADQYSHAFAGLVVALTGIFLLVV